MIKKKNKDIIFVNLYSRKWFMNFDEIVNSTVQVNDVSCIVQESSIGYKFVFHGKRTIHYNS